MSLMHFAFFLTVISQLQLYNIKAEKQILLNATMPLSDKGIKLRIIDSEILHCSPPGTLQNKLILIEKKNEKKPIKK